MSAATVQRRSGAARGARSEIAVVARPTAALEGVTPGRVRERAYELYVARCGQRVAGDEITDWLRAERELKDEATMRVPSSTQRGAPWLTR
jgi:hypothetical protein